MTKESFNESWLFGKKDGGGRERVTLPHDAMILERRDPDSPGGAAYGYFPGGAYIYEKKFDTPADWADKHIFLEFEGVYQNAKVYVNGIEAGGCAYGYSPFAVILDGKLNYGKENVLRVEVDNKMLPGSRWYTGSGIYRPVWLYEANKTHIEHRGVRVTTLSYAPARILIETAHNGGTNAAVSIEILYQGVIIAKGIGNRLELDILGAALWSENSPSLYQCHAVLSENGAAVDEQTETFGIRLVEWSAKGLLINGVDTLLRGACVHHDNGILGARSYAESEERRVRILKQAGYNAIRSSHNPASKSMLSACDKLGMYVIDETWDMWYSHKSKFDYADRFMDNYKYDITAMVERDFNYPSVIMYSICNEISEPKDTKAVDIGREMVEYIHSLDRNRAVTGGVNLFLIQRAAKGNGIYKEDGGRADEKEGKKKKATGSLMFNIIAQAVGTGMNKAANSDTADKAASPFLDILDIAGYNYASGRYAMEGRKHPDRVIMGSETFPQDIAKNWTMVKQYPYLIGDFMWTGWDYLGEAGMGGWNYSGEGGFEKAYPWQLADGGAIDILGNIGAEAEYAAVVWGLRKHPYIGVRPVNHPGAKVTRAVWRGTNAIESWSWKGCEGNSATVEVYTDAYSVELILNGKRLGRKKVKKYKSAFKTRYASGTLTAVAYDREGREVSRSGLESAGNDTRISIIPEKQTVKPNEIVYIDVQLTGSNGIVESNSDTLLNMSVQGGELLAFGSANPKTEENYNEGRFTTYYGRALAVVRAGDAGEMSISAAGKGYADTKVAIKIE